MERAVEQTYLPAHPSLKTAQLSSKDRLDLRFFLRGKWEQGGEPSPAAREAATEAASLSLTAAWCWVMSCMTGGQEEAGEL